MTTKDYCSINFTGLTHDHTLECRGEAAGDENGETSAYCSAIPILKQHPMYDCLVLVRKYRHCLAGYSLEFPVDRVREHERLPTNESAAHHHDHDHHHATADGHGLDECPHRAGTEEGAIARESVCGQQRSACSQRRLVSRFLDGDDPVYRGCAAIGAGSLTSSLSQTSMNANCEQVAATGTIGAGDEAAAAAAAAATASAQTDETDARLLFMTQIDDRGDQCHLVHVPINGLLDRLESYTRNGVAVDSRVYAFAMGLKTAERMMTTKSMKELHETPI